MLSGAKQWAATGAAQGQARDHQPLLLRLLLFIYTGDAAASFEVSPPTGFATVRLPAVGTAKESARITLFVYGAVKRAWIRARADIVRELNTRTLLIN